LVQPPEIWLQTRDSIIGRRNSILVRFFAASVVPEAQQKLAGGATTGQRSNNQQPPRQGRKNFWFPVRWCEPKQSARPSAAV